MLSLFDAQLISLSLLLAGTFASGVLPLLCFRTGSPGPGRVMSSLIYFGGGVLMSTCFLHLLPEARESFENGGGYRAHDDESPRNKTSTAHVHRDKFAIPELVVLCGFFATYLIEELIHHLLLWARRSPESSGSSSGDIRLKFCSCAQRHTECSRTFKDVKPDQSLIGLEKQSGLLLSAGQCFSTMSFDEHQAPRELLQSSIIAQPVPNYGTMTTLATQRADAEAEYPTSAPQPILVPEPIQTPQHHHHHNHHHQHHHHHHPEGRISVGSLLTVAALSFHSVFEGFAIGFQSTAADTWTLLLAVCLHKFVVAFVVGLEVVADGGRWPLVVTTIGVFAVMSPTGTALAMFASRSVDNVPEIIVGSVNCIACGTLLYVTFYEILRREIDNGVKGLLRFLSVAIGAGVMAGLLYASTVF